MNSSYSEGHPQIVLSRLGSEAPAPDHFWASYLSGTSMTPLVVDRRQPRTDGSPVDYDSQVLHPFPELIGPLKALAQAQGLTLEVLCLGAWALLLHRYSSEETVCFGVAAPPAATDRELATLLPLKIAVPAGTLLLPWLQDLQALGQSLQKYGLASPTQLQAWSGIAAASPLFETVVLFQTEQTLAEQNGIPLALLVAEASAELQVCYDRQRFEAATIARLLGHLQTLLESMVVNPHQPLEKLTLLTAAERHQLLEEWNQTQVPYPADQSIHRIFEQQVARTPEAIAVILPTIGAGQAVSITYQELNRRADLLAAQLQHLGVTSGTFVALAMERAIELIVATIGILKAGGVYVPLDPAYPQDRLAWMLEDTQASVLLTQTSLLPHLPPHQAQVLCLDADWGTTAQGQVEPISCLVSSDALAYINYTSGSTGRPKGVAVPHRGVLRLVFGANYTCLDGNQTLLQLAPISFDAATLEIWGALLHGGCCVLFPGNGLPDPADLGSVIRNYGVTTLWLTAALFNTIITEAPETLQGVQELLTGGEALSVAHIRLAQEKLPGTQLINGYGPTESTTFTCCHRIPYPLPASLTSIPIGRPISNTQVYILDATLEPVPIGVPGELYIGGAGLAREYLNRPDLTEERFIPNPFSANPVDRLYKTGDLVRYLSDGTIEFIGRRDNQIKLRGYRIELGEIETVLGRHGSVRDAVVILREDTPGNKQLVAYITAQEGQSPSPSQLKAYLHEHLAEYMVPSALMVLEKIPLTPNGKADRRALPSPVQDSIAAGYVAPGTPLEQTLADLWCGLLGLGRVGVEDNFFDLGGTSLLALQTVTRIQKQLGYTLRTVKLYEYPTIRTLARYLVQQAEGQQTDRPLQRRARSRNWGDRTPDPEAKTALDGVAIIGMVGRFPGADTVAELWQNLCAGKETVTRFDPTEIDPSVDPELRQDPDYVRVKGIIQGAETFDAAFFGISPREAEVMDPQARLFLELAQTALDDAGYTPEQYDGLIGLYAGSGQNTYFERHICGRPEIVNRLGAFQTMLANEKDFVTTRTSYKLNLRGPSVSINTACSTSLVAVIHAFQGLLSHHCDLALAGGISVNTPQNTGYLYQEGGMLSPDGHCRPFDAKAQGTTFNNGAGLVVLKRLADALADGDTIYAVIKGVGMNNDGADKVSFTAPSVQGQAEAILMAQASAGVHPETVTYVETHGTATPLGDPIEIEALTQAFRTQTMATQFCAVGSIKSNMGHLVAAAGVAGLIKTALALKHGQIPPTLFFEAPNPEIDFAHSPFYVNAALTPWERGETPRRAGVSSFGVGGTNAHVILEEAPQPLASSPARPVHLLLLSARSETALAQATANLKQTLHQHPALNLADVAHTLQVGRKAFNHRRFVVCRNREEGVQLLDSLDPTRTGTRQTELRQPEVVFMFPGQGSQYVNMGRNLYDREPVFRATVDECAELLRPYLDQDLRQVLYPAAGNSEAAAALLRQTVYTQPALFTIEYALAQLWQSWGLKPAATIGHSIGEFVSACVAGVFSLADTLQLVAARGRLMWELPPGAMLSVRLPAATVAQRLSPDLSIAAINGPSLCVVSGPAEAIATLQQALEAEEIICKPLHTSHAFHSPMMDPIVEPFAALVRTVHLSPPQIPFVSTVTADWITADQATDPLYWANHLRATVRFAEGVQTLWQQPERVLLEVGPRTTAATLARQQAKEVKRQVALSSLGSTAEEDGEWLALLQAIGQLWLAGVTIDWRSFYADEHRHRLPLPTYPFERQRYWVDPKLAIAEPAPPSPELPAPPPAPAQPEPLFPSRPADPQPEAQPQVMTDPRKQRLIPILQEVFEATSGLEMAAADGDITFLELGQDSLSLTQVALALKKKFKITITFRHLLEECPTLDTLAEFIDRALPADAFPAPAPAALPPAAPVPLASPAPVTPAMTASPELPLSSSPVPPVAAPAPVLNPAAVGAIETVVAQQLHLMTQQLELLRQVGAAPALPASVPLPAPAPAVSPAVPVATASAPVAEPPAEPKPKKLSGPGARIEKANAAVLTAEQQAALDRMIARYTARTAESKRQAQEHRRYLADPRTVSGFTPQLKEMVYPIVTDRSAGSHLWDVDGNDYIDLTNGFGLNFFGWNPDFVTQAVIAQMEKGIEIGPQTPLAGQVAKMITEFTGMDRVAFCNTGSEAVMATLRLARTVTGRSLVATFSGDYHGTFDEVLYRPGPKLRTLPAAPGIMPSMFENLLVLDYGTPEALEILRNQADDLAAILVEPVRSRDPDLQPREFLQDLRQLTERSGTAFIFDEVVTGFRVHPGGAQAYFNIRADMATYGKVVGGGLPIGILAGKSEYMDALDGGFWQFGDDSIPEVGVTFFAGTFVRHPMALAAAGAVLTKLKEIGPEAQKSLAEKVHKFATHLNQHFERVAAPVKIAHFSSLFYITYPHELPYAQLLFYLLREKGVHVWDHRPCFFTLSHTEEEIERVIRAFKDSVAELQMAGFLPGATVADGANGASNGQTTFDRNRPPQPGARLGKDPEGNPAWYIPDPDRPGKYLKVGTVS
nr:hybrid non-ribosomal peptide synthetase/type I polyketide synthase [Leptolyngbya sp. 'hensonii']